MAFNPTKTRTWKDGATPTTGTLALGSLFNAEFDQLYENDNYLKTNLDALTTIVTDPSLKKKEVDDANYTILDGDGYDVIIFKNLTADRDCNCPTLADNPGRKIIIINESGNYDVNVSPEDRGGGDIDYINDYQADFTITEKWGYLQLIGSIGQWIGKTNGWSSVLYVELGSTETLTTNNMEWDESTALTVTLTPGTWIITYFINQYLYTTSAQQHYLRHGLSTTTGDVAPEIFRSYYAGTYLVDDTNLETYIESIMPEIKHSVSSNTQVWVKSYHRRDGGETTNNHDLKIGGTNQIAYLRARRVA